MRRSRWIVEWKDSLVKPAIYHCISRVCQRQFLLGAEEKEQFRIYMRMYENFSGCRVLSYCIMDNHIHILLEVPPMPPGRLSDDELLKRISALGNANQHFEIKTLLAKARKEKNTELAQEIHESFTYRMHDLSQFMKSVMGRFAQWFNRKHNRKGVFWEDRFKSVIVEDGYASRAMAAYIDLNPVRAGIVREPAKYRWSSYGEAMAGKVKARCGLARAYAAHGGMYVKENNEDGKNAVHKKSDGTVKEWNAFVAVEYRKILLRGAREILGVQGKVVRKGMNAKVAEKEVQHLEKQNQTGKKLLPITPDVSLAKAAAYRTRYFVDGAVIGSKTFINEVFTRQRERFGEKRKDGARKITGTASAANHLIFSMRDLRVRV